MPTGRRRVHGNADISRGRHLSNHGDGNHRSQVSPSNEFTLIVPNPVCYHRLEGLLQAFAVHYEVDVTTP
jgi:hypothetical protein